MGKKRRRKVKKASKKSKELRVEKKSKLTKKELKLYKGLLVKEKLALLKGMDHIAADSLKKSIKDASGDLSSYTFHMADMASDLYERDFSLQLATGEREVMLQIDEAFKRIEEGTYGICQLCEKQINKTRLKAIPRTAYCKECQEKEEKKNA